MAIESAVTAVNGYKSLILWQFMKNKKDGLYHEWSKSFTFRVSSKVVLLTK